MIPEILSYSLHARCPDGQWVALAYGRSGVELAKRRAARFVADGCTGVTLFANHFLGSRSIVSDLSWGPQPKESNRG